MALDEAVSSRLQGRAERAGCRWQADADQRQGATCWCSTRSRPLKPATARRTTVFLEVAAKTQCSHPLIPDYQCLQVREGLDDKGLKQGEPGKFENFYGTIEGAPTKTA